MKFNLLEKPHFNSTNCLVLGVFSDENFTELLTDFDTANQELIKALSAKLKEPGDLIWQGEIQGKTLLLVHCGKAKEFHIKDLRKRTNEIALALLKQGIESVSIALPSCEDKQVAYQLQQMIWILNANLYQLLDFKTNKKNEYKLKQIDFYLPGADKDALEKGEALANGVNLIRNLADLPANICTPTFLANTALEIAEETGIKAKAFGLKEIEDMKMGALLAVAKGSVEEPRFIELQYKGSDSAPIILVGKGITFDSGGLSLKPANAMDEMKYDMCGAATVLGALKAAALLKLPVNLIGLIASCENLPSGNAVKPGDIVTSMSGQTIEILNTDAEGRLVLADALTYAERFNPRLVIDLATLTGAMVVALGAVMTGFMTEDEKWASAIMKASQKTDDKVWRMPLDEAYQDALDSPLADMINASFDRSAGAITAACFLSRFTKKYPWVHFDIAGTAWLSGKKRAATGRPLALLIELLENA